jgi:Fe-S cluster biosynthesis and repair protein YggX
MEITCTRCGATVEAMAAPPLPTPVGELIRSRVCRTCWQEWLRTQVMLINEYRLNLMDPGARSALEEQMRAFLNLPSGELP